MVRDIHMRILFIPLLGLLIPYASHIISYSRYTVIELAASHLYFFFTSFAIWTGCNLAHKYIRKKINPSRNIFVKIFTISSVSAVYSALIGGGLTALWFMLSGETFTPLKLFEFIIYTTIAVTLFTLLYEVLFLNTEKEQHIKIADELDKERLFAETAILRNELDPHFIFNSLTTLNQLIKSDPDKAARYNDNLAQVYKYILCNKNRETVTLTEEIMFIEEYFLLLQIRHGNKLQLETNVDAARYNNYQVIPCALQILVENAVKHNEFTEQSPLKINVTVNGSSLKVSNNIMPRPFLLNSTEIGLNNLKLRYKLMCSREIKVSRIDNIYTVTLPLLSGVKPYNYA